MMNGMTTSKSY